MGCISSKLLPSDDPLASSDHQNSIKTTKISGDLPNHTVSLTSSTYGLLNLDPFENPKNPQFPPHKKLSFPEPSPEIINWILADDVEDVTIPKSFFTPSPKIRKMFIGKENKTPCRQVLKTLTFSENKKSGSRQSLSPLFDPDLVASFERELDSEAEQIKQMASFEEKCPPGGEKSVVLYTTSLGGIRRTFEDCNLVRSLIQSYEICVDERDVSMDLGIREELRSLMGGTTDARLPLLFVRGRIVGGANEVLRLVEERKLGGLLKGIPKAEMSCRECGGLRFVMCRDCNGSCMVWDEGKKWKKVKCVKCNENGLVHCHTCGG